MSAIPPDVQTPVNTATTEVKTRKLSAREEDMERMAQSRRDDFEKETGIKIEPAVVAALADPDADPDDAQAEAERLRLEAGETVEQIEAATAVAKTVTETIAQAATQAPRKLKAKIDGEEIEVTEEEVLREYQKGRTADKRLEAAAKATRDLEERERQLQQQLAQHPTKVGTDVEVVIDPEVTKEFAEALKEGDSDKVTQAFTKAVSSATKAAVEQAGRGNATQPVDPQAIATQVRQQIAIDSVLEQSRKDYPDLYADPDLELLAATKIQRAQSEGKTFAEALTEVTSDLATKFGWQPQGRAKPAAADNRTRSEKLARKAELEQPPNGPNVKSGTTEEPVQTASDVIKDMQRARGQLV